MSAELVRGFIYLKATKAEAKTAAAKAEAKTAAAKTAAKTAAAKTAAAKAEVIEAIADTVWFRKAAKVKHFSQ